VDPVKLKKIDKILGQIIREHRQTKHFTQAQVAKKARLSKCFVSDFENGKRGISLKNLIRITEFGLDESCVEILKKLRGKLHADPENP
jgi:transcriptional regulator with XRE-family HTH domain